MSALARAVRLPLRAVPKKTVVRVLSGANIGQRWVVGSSTHGCWLGWYERPTQRALRALIRPGMTVLDVGANVGFFTLAAARWVGRTGQVIAFEPFHRNAHYLKRHVALNGLTQRVRVEEVALADRTGPYGQLFVGQPASGSLVPKDRGLTGHQVRLVALDDWRRAGTLPHVDVIKMDIEGAEGMALLGMRGVLEADRPALFIALHGGPREAEGRALLAAVGYRIDSEVKGDLIAH